jgi:hypothetical protein
MNSGTASQFLEQLCTDDTFRSQYWASQKGRPLDTLHFALSNDFVFTMTELREALWHFPEHFVIYQMCEMLHIPRARPPARAG